MHPQDITAGRGALAGLMEATRQRMDLAQTQQNAFNNFKNDLKALGDEVKDYASQLRDESRYQEALKRDEQRYNEQKDFRDKSFKEQQRQYEKDYKLRQEELGAKNAHAYAAIRALNASTQAQRNSNALQSVVVNEMGKGQDRNTQYTLNQASIGIGSGEFSYAPKQQDKSKTNQQGQSPMKFAQGYSPFLKN